MENPSLEFVSILRYMELKRLKQIPEKKRDSLLDWNGEESEIQDINPINKKTKSSAVSPTK
jgi:hypothetical protein